MWGLAHLGQAPPGCKLSRAERQSNGPHRNLDRQGAADQKAELVRMMREKARAAEGVGQAGDDTAQS
ncbi:DUF6243 family protein [Streptomyces sp. NBC_01707]|uniref:DUF6243 family protein n=1 Tax=Streptomyces sp. NBC_01707 TaxID=2975914 RepID=UPI00352EC8B3